MNANDAAARPSLLMSTRLLPPPPPPDSLSTSMQSYGVDGCVHIWPTAAVVPYNRFSVGAAAAVDINVDGCVHIWLTAGAVPYIGYDDSGAVDLNVDGCCVYIGPTAGVVP